LSKKRRRAVHRLEAKQYAVETLVNSVAKRPIFWEKIAGCKGRRERRDQCPKPEEPYKEKLPQGKKKSRQERERQKIAM